MTWNGAKIWVVTLSSESIIPTSASHDIVKDLAIVDHLFTEIELVFYLLILTLESCIIYAVAPLSIKILMYLGLWSMPFGIIFIVLTSLLNVPFTFRVSVSNVIETNSSYVEEVEFELFLLELNLG